MSIAETKSKAATGMPEPLFPWLKNAQPWELPEPLFPLPTHLDLPCNEWEARNYQPPTYRLPTHKDLPETDGKPVENTYVLPQGSLLSSVLQPVLDRFHPDGNYLVAADTGIYWMATKEALQGCKAPDWCYIPNVPKLLNGEFRKSYVLWQEGIPPVIAIEFVSGNGADEHDITPGTGKCWVYERQIEAKYYVIWNHVKCNLEVFELNDARYERLKPGADGRFRISQMEIDLGIWEGLYRGITARWLRAWDWGGWLLPTSEESNESERKRADAEKQRADAEKLRADRLAAKLRELGVNPD